VTVGIPAVADATLLLRGLHDPGAWGGVDSPSTLFAHVSAARYRSYDLGWAGLARGEGWAVVARTLARGLAFTGIAAACVGALRLPRRERNASLLLVAAGIVFALRYATEDVDVFLLPSVVGLAMLAAGAVPKRGALAAAILLTAIPAAANFRTADRHADRSARLYAEDMLATLPERATLFVDGDDAFVLAYATQVLGERPDVRLVDRRGLLFASTRFYGPVAGDDARRTLEISEATRGSGPVLFMGWPGYELPEGWRFEPRGLFFVASRASEAPSDSASLWARYHESEIAKEAARRPGAFADAVAATYPLMRAEAALARGDRAAAVAGMEEALRRAPRSETILNTIGTTWARRRDLARAIAAFQQAVRVKPQSLRAWLNLAQARDLSGDRRGAEEAVTKARALARRRP
jgi:tetratricopeptide (TPR) repeat protein